MIWLRAPGKANSFLHSNVWQAWQKIIPSSLRPTDTGAGYAVRNYGFAQTPIRSHSEGHYAAQHSDHGARDLSVV